MEDVKTLVKTPAGVKEMKKCREFCTFVKKELEGLTTEQKKSMKLDLISYVASLAELYFAQPQCGALKRKAVLESLTGVDELRNMEEVLELVLETGRVVRKTTWKRAYLWFKKTLGVVARR